MKARETIIPVFVPHLGCPFNCVFCNQNRISGEDKPATASDVIRAVTEAEEIVADSSKRQLAFYGGSFTAIAEEQQEELLSAAERMVEQGKIDSIRLSTRPDAIDASVIDRLKKYSVDTVELGAQSMCSDVLLKSGRGHTAEDVENASMLIKKAGFRLILQMMTGLPGDTAEKCYETAVRIAALEPDGVRIYPTVVVKDTALYDLWETGKYKEHTVEQAVEFCSVIVPVFERKKIPVIRLGLNPTEELSHGTAAAGAYHPALGELVKSRILRNRVIHMLSEVPSGSKVVLGVNKSRVSQMIGQHRCNVVDIVEKLKLTELKVVPTDVDYDEIKIIQIV